MDEEKIDAWLEKHPRLDRLHDRWWVIRRRVQYGPRNLLNSIQEWREWKPGSYYLDHGSIPCVLIRRDYGSLLGVSLVTGDIMGGCDIYHCGPEHIEEKEAWELARALRRCAEGEHEYQFFADLNVCRYCDEPEGGWPQDPAEQEKLHPYWVAALEERAAHG